ncbi:MAG: amino acid ABC transporter substrate-binding protein [Thermoguttaceae bacterium]
MKQYLIAGLALSTLLGGSTALADHRPGNVVVMGGTVSLTGRYVEPSGRIHNGQKLYVEELNAGGGLLGHKVELKFYDDKSDKRTAIELYQKLITEDKVDLVLGPYSSYLTDTVANVMERYKRPFVSPGASATVIWQRGRKYVFSNPFVIAQDRQKGALLLAAQIGVKRIAVIGEGSVFPRQATEGVMRWAKKLRLKVVLLESYRKGQTDFTAVLQRMKASGAEAIFSNGYYNDTVAQIRQLRELDINVKMFAATVGPAVAKFVKELGSTAEFVVGSSQWEPKLVLGYPGMKGFIENYEKRYGVTPNYHASGGYSAIQIFVAAVKKAGSFDPEKIREALASITVQTVRGRWKANGKGLSNIEPLTIQIQNGKRVIVSPAHQSEAKFLPMPKWEDRAKK